MNDIRLKNGLMMPKIGFGTARITGDECINAVANAINIGYKMIDTAHMYNNEAEVGIGIKASLKKREDIFITTKIYSVSDTYDKAVKQIKQSLKLLQVSYIDLVLIHEPFDGDTKAYMALEDLYEKGIIKAIGVSNFNLEYLGEFIKKVKIIPMINQVECHPYHQQLELKQYMDSLDIIMESYASFASGNINYNDDIILKSIANKYKKTVYQVILNYLLSIDIICIPKSVNVQRMKENLNCFDFSLTKEEIEQIKELDKKQSLYGW